MKIQLKGMMIVLGLSALMCACNKSSEPVTAGAPGVDQGENVGSGDDDDIGSMSTKQQCFDNMGKWVPERSACLPFPDPVGTLQANGQEVKGYSVAYYDPYNYSLKNSLSFYDMLLPVSDGVVATGTYDVSGLKLPSGLYFKTEWKDVVGTLKIDEVQIETELACNGGYIGYIKGHLDVDGTKLHLYLKKNGIFSFEDPTETLEDVSLQGDFTALISGSCVIVD